MERLEQDQDTAILQDENDVMENISAEIPEEDIDFRLQVSAPKKISSVLQIELEEAEQYLAASELTGSNTEKMPNLSYKNYFGEFKEQRKNLKHILSEGNQEQAYAFLEALNNRSDNPFIQHLLGEMYLYGQLVEVSMEKAEECFQAALSRFEKDVYTIPEEEKGFDYQRYVFCRMSCSMLNCCFCSSSRNVSLPGVFVAVSATDATTTSPARSLISRSLSLMYCSSSILSSSVRSCSSYVRSCINPVAT